MKKIIPTLVFISFLFTNCSLDEDEHPSEEFPQITNCPLYEYENENPSEEFPQTITAATFELKTPKGWELIEDQGIDTYIGRIKNQDTTMYFDQGYLSFGNLEDVQETSRTIYFKRLNIYCVPAIILKEYKGEEPSVYTRLSVYLDNGEKQNRLYTLNPNDDEFFIKIFKTHKFL